MGGDDAIHPNAWQREHLPPAGYTYFGQFIDHDLTSDPRRFGKETGRAPVNFRTPRFDLDSVYGSPRRKSLYEGDLLRLAADECDFVRGLDGEAAIHDRRNDSNQIVAQLHLAMARYHNRVTRTLPAKAGRFKQARTIVRNHYQWAVLHDFLPRIVGRQTVDALLSDLGGPRLYRPGPSPALPLEFAAAAFRFGHSMVRGSYVVGALGGVIRTFDAHAPDLRGHRPIDPRHRIEWKHFFRMPGSSVAPQAARPIDTHLARPLFSLPNRVAQDKSPRGRRLPFRNLHRAEVDLGLASGQQLARAMLDARVPLDHGGKPLLGIDGGPRIRAYGAPGDPNIGNTGVSLADLDDRLRLAAPLWYYVLEEADVFHRGVQLGPVAGRLVAEVFVGLMEADAQSVLNTGWTPTAGAYGCRKDGEFFIANLLDFATGCA